MDLKKYQNMKEKADDLQKKSDQNQGAIDQLMIQLKKQHNCNSVEQALKKVEEKQRDLETLEEGFEESSRKFDETYGDLLGEE